MVYHNLPVPADHEVHHIRSKKLLGKCCDGISNLELLDKAAHADLHVEEFLNGKPTKEYLDSVSGQLYPPSWDEF